MRFVGPIVAMMLLAGCQAPPADEAKPDGVQPPGANYDYRYAFRVPGDRVGAVQESHARGCERLGPARCRITALKYGVDDHNRASAVLALALDPEVARAFGKAATDTVIRARGALVSAEVLGDPAAGSVPARLRRAADEAEAKAKDATDGDERAALAGAAARARSAIATIADLDRANGPMLATAPVLISYDAGSGSGVGGASFQGAGDALMVSLAGLATILAGIGPWLVLLIGGALLLRRIVPQDGPASAPAATVRAEEPGVLHRLFHREAAAPEEPKREDA